MSAFFITLGIILLAMGGLGIGVLLGRGPLRGSCGGNATVHLCPACKKDHTP